MQYDICEVLDKIWREDALIATFANSAFKPRTAEDVVAMDSGRPFMALDAGGNLHLVGSVNPPKV